MSTSTNAIDAPFNSERSFNWRSLASVRTVPAVIGAAALVAALTNATSVWLAAFLIVLSVLAAAALRHHVPPADTVVLIGRTPIAAMIANSLESGLAGGGKPLHVLRAQSWGEAATLARSARCDEVIVADPLGPCAMSLTDARGRRPSIVNGSEKLEDVLGRVPLELAEQDRWFSRLGRIRPLSAGYRQSKRVLDLLFVIGVGLIVLPVAPVIALMIKLDSRGPVFYSQQRVGLGGATFRIYKFRTMRQDAETNGAVWAAQADPRITKVGRFMRLTRIDELPQLWNVLKGEMAVVGPRPERPEFTATLAKEITGYDLRQTVKPGLTGWAQVCYRYTNSIRDTKAKVEYDLYYVKHLSLRMDIRILFRTVNVVLGRKGQ